MMQAAGTSGIRPVGRGWGSDIFEANQYMRVWTVQPLIVWQRLQDAGAVAVDSACYPDEYVPWQYRWLADRLKERLPRYEGGLPWWAYGYKPHLRWVRHSRPQGEPQVRIEVEIDADRAIVFPTWAWHGMYTGRFLAYTPEEQEAWETAMRLAVPDLDEWPLPQPRRAELEESWLRLFDPDLPASGWSGWAAKPTCETEAVFGLLRVEDVRAGRHFIGSSNWR